MDERRGKTHGGPPPLEPESWDQAVLRTWHTLSRCRPELPLAANRAEAEALVNEYRGLAPRRGP